MTRHSSEVGELQAIRDLADEEIARTRARDDVGDGIIFGYFVLECFQSSEYLLVLDFDESSIQLIHLLFHALEYSRSVEFYRAVLIIHTFNMLNDLFYHMCLLLEIIVNFIDSYYTILIQEGADAVSH